LHLLIAQGAGPLFGHDDQVRGGQLGFMAAKEFSQQTFDPIAPDGLAQTSGHHQPQARKTQVVGGQGDAEMTSVEPGSLGLGPEEFGAAAEPLRLGETGGPFNGGMGDGSRATAWGFRPAQGGSPTFRPKGASDLWPDGASKSGGRPGCSCGSKTHESGIGADYGVDKCVSFKSSKAI